MIITKTTNSSALIPCQAKQGTRSPQEDKVNTLYKKCFQQTNYEYVHLRTYGTGRIFMLLGQSTAGKTSILHELESTILGAIGLGIDYCGPMLEAEVIKEHEPKLYEKIAKALNPIDIGLAVWGNEDPEMIDWKKGISSDERTDALKAIKEVKEKIENAQINRLSLEVLERKQMDHIIDESEKRPIVAFDPWLDSRHFMQHCAIRNISISARVGLAYCPFIELPARVALRNVKALGEGGDLREWRFPLGPILQFLRYYRPAEEGETVIDLLDRKEVENAFEDAFHQTLSFYSHRIEKDPKAADICEELGRDHDKLKRKVMMKLGFTQSDIEKVGITPRFQNIQYLFNTKVMKPPASAEIIQAWQ